MAEDSKFIYKEPVIDVINKIMTSAKDVTFLMGGTGTGKTVVLNELINNYNVIDGTIKMGEYKYIHDSEVFRLYHVCLIIKKILNYFNNRNTKLILLDDYLNNIFKKIKLMAMINSYEEKNKLIDPSLLCNPENLLLDFLSLLDIDEIKLVIDNFDSVGYGSKFYQMTIYEIFKERIKLITTISDEEVLNNEDRKEKLKSHGDLIELKYTKDLETIKKILVGFGKENRPIYNIRFFLTDKEIEEMINKSNGNLFLIQKVVDYLYKNLANLNNMEYSKYINDYLDQEINRDSQVSGIIMPVRKLHL